MYIYNVHIYIYIMCIYIYIMCIYIYIQCAYIYIYILSSFLSLDYFILSSLRVQVHYPLLLH